MSPDNLLLSVNHISAGYEKLKVLENISIKVYRGEIVALLGRNGTGKSTLFNVIAGINSQWSGDINFKGEEITNKSANYIYQHGVSFMPQGGRIFPKLTIYDNLIFNTNNKLITKKTIVQIIESLLCKNAPKMWEHCQRKMLGDLNQNAGKLSGGERQILSIIRTLINENDLFLLDEPTCGLSYILIEELKNLLKYKAESGCGIVFIEQQINWSLSICNRVCILQKGVVVYEGGSTELKENEKKMLKYLGV